MNKRNGEQSLAQQRREIRDQCIADCRARVVKVHTRRALEVGAKVFPNGTGLAACVQAAVEAWCGVHPDPGATLMQASTHEAGHFVAAAKLGLDPVRAEVHGTPGRTRGYGGIVWARDRPAAPKAHGVYTADDVQREAVFALAGLLAEWWLTGGDPYANPSEILEACMLAAHLADMLGLDRAPVLADIFTFAMQIVITFSVQIELIAVVLKRKRKIIYATRGVAMALQSTGGRILDELLPLAPHEDVALRDMMLRAPIDLARFTEEVGR